MTSEKNRIVTNWLVLTIASFMLFAFILFDSASNLIQASREGENSVQYIAQSGTTGGAVLGAETVLDAPEYEIRIDNSILGSAYLEIVTDGTNLDSAFLYLNYDIAPDINRISCSVGFSCEYSIEGETLSINIVDIDDQSYDIPLIQVLYNPLVQTFLEVDPLSEFIIDNSKADLLPSTTTLYIGN